MGHLDDDRVWFMENDYQQIAEGKYGGQPPQKTMVRLTIKQLLPIVMV
jgi:hypothetical protein